MVVQEAPLRSPEVQKVPFVVSVTTSAPPRTVLLVEDNDDLREVMQIFLQINGYHVVACNDAQQASAGFRHNSRRVDALLTDIEMPGQSGIELARELTGYCPSLPVLIVSGSWITPEMSQEFQSRGWKYLSKPVGLPALQTALEILLRPVVQGDTAETERASC